MESYFRYWGKADPKYEGEPKWHPLVYHCLDVAAVGWLLFDPEKLLNRRLARQLRVRPAWLQRWFSFCLSLHDIGKFATAFQGVVPDLSPALVPSNPRMPYTERHDTLGFLLWQEVLASRWVEKGGFDHSANHPELAKIIGNIGPWMEIVTGHHGEPPKRMPLRYQNFFEEHDEKSANRFREDVANLLLVDFEDEILRDKALRSQLKFSSWVLAGLVVLADWLGSSRNPAAYCRATMTLADYWRSCALPFAATVMANADLSRSVVASFAGTSSLFPFITSLTPLQEWSEKRELGETNQLFILEDVTGAGKTEAALVLAHRLMARGLADGIYVALPTMATANAMYERLGKSYRRLYATSERPSLVLAHGSRHLSEGFRNSVGLPESLSAKKAYADDEEPGEAFCSTWLADSRKKALLAEVGVGTLDQALLSVLPARHQSLRLLGLARKVLIVDEVHAYDPYMNQLLQTLLEVHARQGGSAILLSATLPWNMREKYVRSFCAGADLIMPSFLDGVSYPLATHISNLGSSETHLPTRRDVERTVIVSMIEEVDEALAIIKETVEKGQCICWVRNTVNDARAAYQLLANRDWLDKGKLMIFHSRFAMVDRQRIEKATLGFFGKDSTSEQRRGRVLVSTQVVEQSLDLDFDVMISDLAPIDLIIQRAGRLRRHVRDAAGNPMREERSVEQRGKPHLYVFGPAPTAMPTEDWLKTKLPGTQAIYQHVGQLWLTQQRLGLMDENGGISKGRLSMPGDARSLIEGVYGDTAQDNIPEALLGLSWNAEGEAGGRRGMARLNALKLEKGYTRASAEDSGGWDKETRIPTRLGDDSITVALARIEGNDLKPYAEAPEFAWDLSMVDLPRKSFREVQEKIPGRMADLIKRLREEVKLLKWVEVLPMTEELSPYYDSNMGWGLIKEEGDESD